MLCPCCLFISKDSIEDWNELYIGSWICQGFNHFEVSLIHTMDIVIILVGKLGYNKICCSWSRTWLQYLTWLSMALSDVHYFFYLVSQATICLGKKKMYVVKKDSNPLSILLSGIMTLSFFLHVLTMTTSFRSWAIWLFIKDLSLKFMLYRQGQYKLTPKPPTN